MRKLRTCRIALLSAPTAREDWTTFDHQGTAENGWQFYTGDLDDHPQTMKLCPNFALYYPAPPKQLHFTSRKAQEITTSAILLNENGSATPVRLSD
jgi:hypothetical protein